MKCKLELKKIKIKNPKLFLLRCFSINYAKIYFQTFLQLGLFIPFSH